MKQNQEWASQKDETEMMKGIRQPMELSLWDPEARKRDRLCS